MIVEFEITIASLQQTSLLDSLESHSFDFKLKFTIT